MRLIAAFKAFFGAFKKPQEKKIEQSVSSDPTHLQMLALLQTEGRLIDFLQEDISAYSNAQVGSAVRDIHRKCSKCLEEFVTLRPVFTESEGMTVSVALGYDPSKIKVVGNVQGNPPYQGVLRHKGWKAHKLSLPKRVGEEDRSIVFPAEVEI